MIKNKEQSNCCGCYACSTICPKQCISMELNNEGFVYPHVDDSLCIKCEACENVCPINTCEPNGFASTAFAAYSRDKSLREKSSSGGVFGELASFFLDRLNGIVYGAALNDELEVYHKQVECVDELKYILGSKYGQSNMNSSYKRIKQQLELDRFVLFCGTPCQVNALSSYLGRKYENLLMIAIVCHGVPSDKVWKLYLNSLKGKRSIFNLNFRDKRLGWYRYGISIGFSNGETYFNERHDDLFMNGYIENLFSRLSCYDCKFKIDTCVADIILGDFWNIDSIYPKINDNKGITLVIVQSDSGMSYYKQVESKLVSSSVPINEAIRCNRTLIESPVSHIKRKEFLETVNELNFENRIKSFVRVSLWKTLKKRIKYLTRK